MELLISAIDNKGEIIEVRANGTRARQGWEGAIFPGQYIYVECHERVVTKDLPNLKKWRQVINMGVLGHDPVTDTYTVQLSATSGVAASGRGGIFRDDVIQVLNNWNAANIMQDGHTVTFSLSLFGALTCEGYWDHDVSGVVFSELNYDQATGVHRIQIEYGALAPTAIQNVAESKGLDIISHNNGILIVEGARSDIQGRFKQDIEHAISGSVIGFSRWRLSDSAVNLALNQGGVVSVTWAQLQSNLEDQAAI